jgi:hypothetical protein
VKVEVEDMLPASAAVRLDEIQPLGRKPIIEEMAIRLAIAITAAASVSERLSDVGGMSPWDHQGVAFGGLAAIKDGQCQFILSYDIGSQLAGDDLTENALHGPRLPRRSGTPRSGGRGQGHR